MSDYLESLDRSFVLFVNGWNSPFLDEFMWIVSAKLTWVPLYILLLFLFIKQSGAKKGIVFLLCAIAAVAITDQVSVHLFKEVFLRYRPSHNLLLTDKLHFYNLGGVDFYKGGMYGFVSSHAANFFAVCTFSFLALRKTYVRIGYWLFAIASLVCLSRIYLGVHYFSDVLVGSLLGIVVAILVFRFIFVVLIGKEYIGK